MNFPLSYLTSQSIADPTINFPKTWFTADKLVEFWYYVKWFMRYNMPIFMICMAIIVVSIVLYMVVDIPLEARKEPGGRNKSDDDDFDLEYY